MKWSFCIFSPAAQDFVSSLTSGKTNRIYLFRYLFFDRKLIRCKHWNSPLGIKTLHRPYSFGVWVCVFVFVHAMRADLNLNAHRLMW